VLWCRALALSSNYLQRAPAAVLFSGAETVDLSSNQLREVEELSSDDNVTCHSVDLRENVIRNVSVETLARVAAASCFVDLRYNCLDDVTAGRVMDACHGWCNVSMQLTSTLACTSNVTRPLPVYGTTVTSHSGYINVTFSNPNGDATNITVMASTAGGDSATRNKTVATPGVATVPVLLYGGVDVDVDVRYGVQVVVTVAGAPPSSLAPPAPLYGMACASNSNVPLPVFNQVASGAPYSVVVEWDVSPLTPCAPVATVFEVTMKNFSDQTSRTTSWYTSNSSQTIAVNSTDNWFSFAVRCRVFTVA
jgi:hypothetical protein